MLAERASRIMNLGLVAMAAAMAAACSSGDDSTPAGGGGSGGGGTGGSTSSGGTLVVDSSLGGAGGGLLDAPVGDGPICPPPQPTLMCTPAVPAQALIADFTLPEAGTTLNCDGTVGPNAFGTYGADLFGGTYVYPSGCTDACNPAAPISPYPLVQDLSAGNWHITGTLGNYSGMGLWINRNVGPGPTEGTFSYVGLPSHAINASGYSGVRFTISGNAGASGVVFVNLGSGSTTTMTDASLHTTCGTCTAAVCASTPVSVPVTATPTTVTVSWTQAGITDPQAFMGLSWYFTPPGGIGTPTVASYAVDITIDNIEFAPL
jgi:hypothetical protein